jgi:DNA-binding NtrC family response regulator
VPDKDISTLRKILSLIIDELGSAENLASLEAIESEVEEEWPALADVEGAYVGKVLRHTRGNKQAAARLLRIDRKTLDRMIRRHKLNLSETRTETSVS